jgi:hypothetical protein
MANVEELGREDRRWIYLAQIRFQRRVLVLVLLNLRVHDEFSLFRTVNIEINENKVRNSSKEVLIAVIHQSHSTNGEKNVDL